MIERVQLAQMVFVGAGGEGIGAVREIRPDEIVVFVENAGEFVVPATAIHAVHDDKVVLAADRLDSDLLAAIGHRHDREDPNVAG